MITIKPYKNYVPKTYDPTENGEKFFKLDRHCKVNGKYPKQVIYFDNLFRTNKKEKLLKLIKK